MEGLRVSVGGLHLPQGSPGCAQHVDLASMGGQGGHDTSLGI